MYFICDYILSYLIIIHYHNLYSYIFLHSTDKKNNLLISVGTILDSLWRKIKCYSFLSINFLYILLYFSFLK